ASARAFDDSSDYTSPAPPDICPLSLHDALPISSSRCARRRSPRRTPEAGCKEPASAFPRELGVLLRGLFLCVDRLHRQAHAALRSEEHTSELQSLTNLVCRLLLETKTITTRRRR